MSQSGETRVFGHKGIRGPQVLGTAVFAAVLAFSPALMAPAAAEFEVAPCASSAGQPACPALSPEDSVAIISSSNLPLARADVTGVHEDDGFKDNLTWPRLLLLAIATFGIASFLAKRGAGNLSRDFGPLSKEEQAARASFQGPFLTSDGKPIDFDATRSRNRSAKSTRDNPHPFLKGEDVAHDPAKWEEGGDVESIPSVLHTESSPPPPSWGSVGSTPDAVRSSISQPAPSLLGEDVTPAEASTLAHQPPAPVSSAATKPEVVAAPTPSEPAPETPAPPSVLAPSAPVSSDTTNPRSIAEPVSSEPAPPAPAAPSVLAPKPVDASAPVPSPPTAGPVTDPAADSIRPTPNDDQMPNLLANLPFAAEGPDGETSQDDGAGWWSTFEQPNAQS